MMQACDLVGADMEMPGKSVWSIIQRFKPTTDLGKMYMKAKAYRMTKRLVKEAKAGELIDILSRPGMGVIEPAVKNEGGAGGFFLSVAADSCGAVKVGVATGSFQPQKAHEMEGFDPYRPQTTDKEGYRGQKSIGPVRERETAKSAIERAREKLAAARHSGRNEGRGAEREGDERVTVLDGELESEVGG